MDSDFEPSTSSADDVVPKRHFQLSCSRKLVGAGVLLWLVSIVLSCLLTRWVMLRAFAGRGVARSAGLHMAYDAALRDAEYVDLTHAFAPNTPVWQAFGQAKVSGGDAGVPINGFVGLGDTFDYGTHGFVTTQYAIPTDQYGTQLDPPAHWNEMGATISDLPATFAVRPLVVVDISPKVRADPKYAATVEDVQAWERRHGTTVPEGSAVFFRSDWSKGWENYTSEGMPAAFPGVSLAALKFLHTSRGILFHGHEPLDTDSTPTLEGEAWLMHNNFAQAEGVTNLDKVPEQGCLVSIGFAKPLGGTGGYARFVAICPPGTTSGGQTVDKASGAPLPVQQHPLRRNAAGVMVPTPGAAKTQYCKEATALGCRAVDDPVWKP